MYLVMVKLQKWMFLELFLNVQNLRIFFFFKFILSEKVKKKRIMLICAIWSETISNGLFDVP